ncbi:hypothetical protein H0H93_004200 [Arthromyces matolae]|nr:hypothetical protein H0H93_004200 [Arthromyces matolae]
MATAGVTAVFSLCMGIDMDRAQLSGKLLHMVKKTDSSAIKIKGFKDKPEFKKLTIKIKYKHIMTNATLQYFRSSKRKAVSFGGSVKSYLATDKGWFAPYLFATGRRPIIPRYKKADVIYCRGPFIKGDSEVGEVLLEATERSIILCDPPVVMEPLQPEQRDGTLAHPSGSEITSESPPQSVEPTLLTRRLVISLVALKPYRMLWSSSVRPSESIIKYILFNGCPAIVVPTTLNAPLLAWSTLTLKQLWKFEVPRGAQVSSTPSTDTTRDFEDLVTALCEYLDHCVDWERVVWPKNGLQRKKTMTLQQKKGCVKKEVAKLVAFAVRTRCNKKLKKRIDAERCGIAFWRIS